MYGTCANGVWVCVCSFFRSLLNWLISQILLRAEQYLVIIEFRKCLYLWKLFAKQNSYHWIIKDKETSLLTLINLLLVWKIYSIAVEFTHQTAGNLGHSTSIEKNNSNQSIQHTAHTHTHICRLRCVCVLRFWVSFQLGFLFKFTLPKNNTPSDIVKSFTFMHCYVINAH